jgi:hypothetical protein
MNNQQHTTQHTEAPEQPTLPGIDTVRTASDSDRALHVRNESDSDRALHVRTESDSDRVPDIAELTQENAHLKAELRMRTAIYDIETRLAQAGAKSPNLLTDRAKDTFEFSDEGELINAEQVVEHLKQAYPAQFPNYSIDAAAGRTPRPTLTKQALAQMTIPEVQQLDWNEVRSALQGN